MDYKPYSMEWTRRRYLAEAIQQYFDTDATIDNILDDIIDVLSENVEYHRSRADKFNAVLSQLKSLPQTEENTDKNKMKTANVVWHTDVSFVPAPPTDS